MKNQNFEQKMISNKNERATAFVSQMMSVRSQCIGMIHAIDALLSEAQAFSSESSKAFGEAGFKCPYCESTHLADVSGMGTHKTFVCRNCNKEIKYS